MIEEIIKKAKSENKKVYVYAHKFPDGDAIASSSALAEYLRSQGIDARYVVTKENKAYNQIVGSVTPTQTVSKEQISIILDTSTVSYAENKLFMSSKKEDIYVIDHHGKTKDTVCIEDELGLSNENVIRESNASSTCEILAGKLGKISPQIANMLTLGLLTDTAKLKFLKSDTLQNLIKLLEQGADYQEISVLCNRKSRLRDEVGLAKLFLGTTRFPIGDTFGMLMPVNNSQIKELSSEYGIRNPQKKIFKMADIENCSFNCMIAENMSGIYDLEFRSTAIYGNFDVLKLATMHRGGGHYNASGCTIRQSEENSIESISKELQGQVADMYSKQGTNLPTIQITKQDRELTRILDRTSRLTKGVTPEVLRQVDGIIAQGGNYDYTFKTLRTFERFMLENEILSRVSKDKLFDRVPSVNIVLSSQDVNTLKQKYNASESDILNAIRVFSNISIERATITLPDGKKSQIDRNGNIKEEKVEQFTR